MNRFTLWTIAAGWTLLALFSGCRSITPAVTYYTIPPIAGEASIMDSDLVNATRVGIRPVELPGIVSRVQMVRQVDANRMEISAFNRWADHPDRLIQGVLEQNLTLLLPDAQVISSPWPVGFQPDVILSIQFIQFIGTADKKVRLDVDWTVSFNDQKSSTETYRRTFIEPMSGAGFDDLAAAHGRVMGTFCREVAGTLVPSTER